MFKKDWGKTDQQFQLVPTIINGMIQLAFPSKKLISAKVISGGCANLNIKIQIENEPFFILRIYLREKDASYREQKLGHLLSSIIPLPDLIFIGDYETYRFAIIKFIPGITLRDLLLSSKSYNIEKIMKEVGVILAKIHNYHFPAPGLLDNDLNILPLSSSENYKIFAQNCLTHPTIMKILDEDLIIKMKFVFDEYQSFFPSSTDSYLVHADYDPANILVTKEQGEWKITGIMDWEFSFSGSPLWDVANMLRYAHQMPSIFKESFLQGLESKGKKLPLNWQTTIHLLNLLSLLDCLTRCQSRQQPRQWADISALINYILDNIA